MSCFRLMVYNQVDIDILANSDVSSEQVAFPITNAYNRNRRSKVWRSNGYYNVTSSNNQIVFRETIAGPDLLATIVVGEYITSTAMCTAIKTALDDAGISTYTVTNSVSTNYKFRLVSNGLGGGGVFRLLVTDSDFTATDLLGFVDTSDLTGALTYNSDFMRINTSEWILWDMGISTNPTSFALIGARNRAIKLSPSAVIKLQGNETNVWTSPSYETTLTYDDEIMADLSDTGLHTEALRYWRIQFEDQNPFGYLEVGAFYLGNHFVPDVGRVKFGWRANLIDRSENLTSEGGQEYSDIREQTEEYSFEWNFMQKEDVEEVENIFSRYGTHTPFFISMDSDAAYSTIYNRKYKFVKFANEPDYTIISPDNFTMTMKVREQL